ncbi:cupin domain-containing protein [Amycolatopsis cynarae]|uniref:Cupin domain-containing protein n=2 Tax=Amycolatopsis TaxID=1813 RepID=A0A558D531_9PSEU|nr:MULTISPECIES: cupin domain-containing protein [Amycolatopsis]TVT56125.1 cupin domain-containing protein [Amycolatopsis rhizosphaerae]WAL66144.1 cupin domain-containing protein [Amycolatopsis sp. HUAS 11-8]
MTYLPVVVRADDAEYLPAIAHHLLADSSATGGALSSHRVTLPRGANGARPHRHDRGSELFFVLDGALDVLVDRTVLSAAAGDLVVVPPGSAHAFAAAADRNADVLIVITPGVERFEYLRTVEAIRTGHAAPDALDAHQERYDTFFLDSEIWAAHLRANSSTRRE